MAAHFGVASMHESSGAGALERYSFLVVFANDGVIDADELRFMEHLALSDGVIDDEEREVLRAIFTRVDRSATSAAVQQEIRAFRARFGI
jgi:hypothetical protein